MKAGVPVQNAAVWPSNGGASASTTPSGQTEGHWDAVNNRWVNPPARNITTATMHSSTTSPAATSTPPVTSTPASTATATMPQPATTTIAALLGSPPKRTLGGYWDAARNVWVSDSPPPAAQQGHWDTSRNVWVSDNPQAPGYWDPAINRWVTTDAKGAGGYWDSARNTWVPVPASNQQSGGATIAAPSTASSTAAAETKASVPTGQTGSSGGYWDASANRWVTGPAQGAAVTNDWDHATTSSGEAVAAVLALPSLHCRSPLPPSLSPHTPSLFVSPLSLHLPSSHA